MNTLPVPADETGLNHSTTVGNAALEIACILSGPQNEQLHEEEDLKMN